MLFSTLLDKVSTFLFFLLFQSLSIDIMKYGCRNELGYSPTYYST